MKQLYIAEIYMHYRNIFKSILEARQLEDYGKLRLLLHRGGAGGVRGTHLPNKEGSPAVSGLGNHERVGEGGMPADKQ